MEMIESSRRSMVPAGNDRRDEPWAVEIRERYGEFTDFSRRFGVMAQDYCLKNVERAVWMDLPVFARIIGAYGQREVESLIAVHITDAVTRSGAETAMDSVDVMNAARSMCDCIPARTLRFSSVFAFFQLFKCGEFEVFGALNTHRLMTAFRKWVSAQRAREDRIAEERDNWLMNERRKKWASEGVTYEEYARMRGEKQDSILARIFGRGGRMADRAVAQA